MNAEIIAVGSELLSPTRQDTNSLFITGVFESLGIDVVRKMVIGDGREQIKAALVLAMEASEIVVLTGGLGPTSDDVTREAVSEALARGLALDPGLLRRLERMYRRIGRQMTGNNQRQAMVPEGAEVLKNPNGTAPGLLLREADRLIFLLPGPPRELQPMVRSTVVPLILKHKQTTPRFQRQLRVASMAESAVDHQARPVYESYPEVETTILSSPGVIDLIFNWRGDPTPEIANSRLDQLVREMRDEMGDCVFTDRPEELEVVIGRALAATGLTLATAESCTGGLIAKLVTDVPGSSEYFLGSVVSYSNDLKTGLLDVEEAALEAFGAVSQEVAEQMAANICRLTGADVGLSVTGVAGPRGGTEEKPVGTVYFGLCLKGKTRVERLLLPGDRNVIRLRSARFALDWLRRELLK